jgi:hypothetical protein
MNLFFEDTGMVLKKKSFIEAEASLFEVASSEALKRNLISLGLILKPLELMS